MNPANHHRFPAPVRLHGAAAAIRRAAGTGRRPTLRETRGNRVGLRHRLVVSFLLLLALAAMAHPAAAQATSYVSGLDPAYHDLDLLLSAGLVRDIMVGERPYSRAAFRRFAEEAARRLEGEPGSPRAMEALERLTRRFLAGPDSAGSRPLHPTPARVDLVVSRSPGRPLRSGADGSIDGSLNPLLQRNQGRVVEDGMTAAFEAGLALEAGPLAVEFTPRAYAGAPRGPAEARVSANVLGAYARAVVGPVALDVGRNSVSLGYGADGGALLSNNARGLDMVRLAADRPVRLPGPLGALGLWQGSFALADMGNDRDVPGSTLALMRLSARPGRYLELGVNYLNLQGGEGAPEASFRDRIHDLFFFWQDGGYLQISDKVAGADLRISVPEARSALYVNFLTTDDRGRFKQPAGGYWEDAIWLVGAQAQGLGAEGRVDFRLEWRHAGPRAHTHHQFTSGVTLDRRVLGEALGPNAAGVSAGLDWTGPVSRVRLTGAWERYSGGDYYWDRIPGGGFWDFDWYLAADNPDEIRKRLVLDYLRFEGWRDLETSLRVGYEHVTRFDYTDRSRHNVLAQLSLRYLW